MLPPNSGRDLDLTNSEVADAALSLGGDDEEFLTGRQIQHQARLKRFLVILARTGRLMFSAQQAGYKDTTYVNRVRLEDPKFDQAYKLAMDAASDILEEEAVRRAVEGVEVDVYHQGVPVGTRINYSDTLLQFLLKGAKKDKYAQHSKQETTVSGSFGIAILPMAANNTDQWAQQASITHNQQKENQKQIIDAEFEELL